MHCKSSRLPEIFLAKVVFAGQRLSCSGHACRICFAVMLPVSVDKGHSSDPVTDSDLGEEGGRGWFMRLWPVRSLKMTACPGAEVLSDA